MARPKEISRSSMLDAAKRLLVERGFNAFSTRTLADEIGISSASLHHHFPTKGDLVSAVAGLLRERLNQEMSTIASELEGFELRVTQVCALIGNDAGALAMLAADFPTYPLNAQNEVRQLFANLRGWLSRFATQGKTDGELNPDVPPDEAATDIFSRLLGRALIARTDSTLPLRVPSNVWAWQR